jgi:hypothetical protein
MMTTHHFVDVANELKKKESAKSRNGFLRTKPSPLLQRDTWKSQIPVGEKLPVSCDLILDRLRRRPPQRR